MQCPVEKFTDCPAVSHSLMPSHSQGFSAFHPLISKKEEPTHISDSGADLRSEATGDNRYCDLLQICKQHAFHAP